MISYRIRLVGTKDETYPSLSQLAVTFDFDHHEADDVEVWSAEVDEVNKEAFERELEQHPNLFSFEEDPPPGSDTNRARMKGTWMLNRQQNQQ